MLKGEKKVDHLGSSGPKAHRGESSSCLSASDILDLELKNLSTKIKPTLFSQRT